MGVMLPPTPPYQVIVGYDYKQVPLNSSSACTRACCAESKCMAWAVAKGMCWLKNGWSFQARARQHVKVLRFRRCIHPYTHGNICI